MFTIKMRVEPNDKAAAGDHRLRRKNTLIAFGGGVWRKISAGMAKLKRKMTVSPRRCHPYDTVREGFAKYRFFPLKRAGYIVIKRYKIIYYDDKCFTVDSRGCQNNAPLFTDPRIDSSGCTERPVEEFRITAKNRKLARAVGS